jgi:hypothetical protein
MKPVTVDQEQIDKLIGRIEDIAHALRDGAVDRQRTAGRLDEIARRLSEAVR